MAQLPYDLDPSYVKKQKGFATLLSVLVFTIAGLFFIHLMTVFGIGQIQSSLSIERSGQARALANTCAEEALQQINDTVSFSGTGSLLLSTGTCDYRVIILSGPNRQVQATGTAGNAVRHVFVSVDQINPMIHIASWQEVGAF